MKRLRSVALAFVCAGLAMAATVVAPAPDRAIGWRSVVALVAREGS